MIPTILAKWMLSIANPEKMLKKSQTEAIRLWNKLNPKIENSKQKSSTKIKSIEEYKANVPIISKETVFEKHSLKELIASKLSNINFVMMSSGSSSKFSIGVLSRKEMKKAAQTTDFFLELFFGASKNKTLIINSASMGVRVFSNHVISDTGPRTDIVIGLLKKVASYYEKIFIMGDPIFIKLMVEESIEADINWDKINAFFISGGEWMPETLRTYVHRLTGKTPLNPKKGFWVGTYGLTELGYPLFFETAELVEYRSKLSQQKSDYFQSNTETCCTTPFIFYYRASSYFLEAIKNNNGNSRLVFTTLDKRRLIPLFRYDTCDLGELIDKDNLQFKNQVMPLVQFWGRDNNFIVNGNSKIHVSDIQELLFSENNLNNHITGFFTLLKDEDKVLLTVQLKKNKTVVEEQKLSLNLKINNIYPNLIDLKFVSYHDMKYQMELDFETKFHPLIEKT